MIEVFARDRQEINDAPFDIPQRRCQIGERVRKTAQASALEQCVAGNNDAGGEEVD